MTLEEQWAEMAQRQDREKLESYRQLNRLAKKGQVVFTGSSLMEQFPLNEMLQGEALPLSGVQPGDERLCGAPALAGAGRVRL